MTTLADIKTEVTEITNRTDKASLIVRGINYGLEEVSKIHDWSQLRASSDQTLLINSESITLPTDLVKIFSLTLVDDTMSRQVILKDETWLEKRFPYVSTLSKARPAYGYRRGQLLYVLPHADVEYTIRVKYKKFHPVLSLDADEVLIPGLAIPLVAYGCYWTYLATEQLEIADRWLKKAADSLKSAVTQNHDNANDLRSDFESPTRHTTIEPWLDPFARSDP